MKQTHTHIHTRTDVEICKQTSPHVHSVALSPRHAHIPHAQRRKGRKELHPPSLNYYNCLLFFFFSGDAAFISWHSAQPGWLPVKTVPWCIITAPLSSAAQQTGIKRAVADIFCCLLQARRILIFSSKEAPESSDLWEIWNKCKTVSQ